MNAELAKHKKDNIHVNKKETIYFILWFWSVLNVILVAWELDINAGSNTLLITSLTLQTMALLTYLTLHTFDY